MPAAEKNEAVKAKLMTQDDDDVWDDLNQLQPDEIVEFSG